MATLGAGQGTAFPRRIGRSLRATGWLPGKDAIVDVGKIIKYFRKRGPDNVRTMAEAEARAAAVLFQADDVREQ